MDSQILGFQVFDSLQLVTLQTECIECILNKLRGTSDECRSKSMSKFRQSGAEFLSVLITSCPEILCVNSSMNRAYISPFLPPFHSLFQAAYL